MKKCLSDARPGETVIIDSMNEKVMWLSKIGFIPGTPVSIFTHSASGVTLRIRGVKYAMSPKLARSVYFKRTDN